MAVINPDHEAVIAAFHRAAARAGTGGDGRHARVVAFLESDVRRDLEARAAVAPQPPAEARAQCQECMGAGGRRWYEADGSERGETCETCDGFGHVAAPPSAPAAQGGGEVAFAEWLATEMPAGTVIGDPAWWAGRIARQYAKRTAPPSAPVGVALLCQVYCDAYHSGHHATVEGGYVDVLWVDRDTYWQEKVEEDYADALAQQPAAVDGGDHG